MSKLTTEVFGWGMAGEGNLRLFGVRLFRMHRTAIFILRFQWYNPTIASPR